MTLAKVQNLTDGSFGEIHTPNISTVSIFGTLIKSYINRPFNVPNFHKGQLDNITLKQGIIHSESPLMENSRLPLKTDNVLCP